MSSEEAKKAAIERALRSLAEDLADWSEVGADERRAAFMRAHFELPDTPLPIQHAGERAYLEWVVNQCMAMYKEGTPVAKAAAPQAFGVFLRRYPRLARYTENRPSPFTSVVGAARRGQQAFERAMREYLMVG